MKVAHIAASMSPEWGGPTKIIAGLTKALVEKGINVSVFAPIADGEDINTCELKGVDIKLFPKSLLSRFWTSYSSPLAKALIKEASYFDLIHIHEIWHHPHYVAHRVAKRFDKPYLVTIHSALEPWCLNYKAFKKKIYGRLIQKRILKEASLLHAITENEVKNIRAFVINNTPIVMIPNGINLQEFQNLPPKEDVVKFYPQLKDKKIILFLGRIHPIKGLDLLAKAFAKISQEVEDIYLLVVGPDEGGYQAQIEKLLAKEGVLNKVIFTGMLTGYKKLAALSGADFCVIPSYSEVRGIVALEAMACGLPVIVTTGCNFPEVAEYNAGIVINPDVDELAKAMTTLLVGTRHGVSNMEKNGKRLVLEKYTWDKVADKMITAYEEILGSRKADMEAI